ncbi:MAG: hypothetical protein HZC36_03520 [Armatimonadetes bacterium]|nr:hypothetical protein [Armatimonadota bacterium]
MLESLTSDLALGILLGMWALNAIPLYFIAKRAGEENAWLAFVPIGNSWLMLNIAGWDSYWLLALLIPWVSWIVMALVWMGIAETMDKPAWTGLLWLVPGLGLAVPWWLAFAP